MILLNNLTLVNNLYEYLMILTNLPLVKKFLLKIMIKIWFKIIKDYDYSGAKKILRVHVVKLKNSSGYLH